MLTFPDPVSTLAVRRSGRDKFSDQEFRAFCEANRDLHIERSAEGEIVVAPPAGGESAYRNTKAVSQLGVWAEADGSGTAFGSSVQYFLPMGPDFPRTHPGSPTDRWPDSPGSSAENS